MRFPSAYPQGWAASSNVRQTPSSVLDASLRNAAHARRSPAEIAVAGRCSAVTRATPATDRGPSELVAKFEVKIPARQRQIVVQEHCG